MCRWCMSPDPATDSLQACTFHARLGNWSVFIPENKD